MQTNAPRYKSQQHKKKRRWLSRNPNCSQIRLILPCFQENCSHRRFPRKPIRTRANTGRKSSRRRRETGVAESPFATPNTKPHSGNICVLTGSRRFYSDGIGSILVASARHRLIRRLFDLFQLVFGCFSPIFRLPFMLDTQTVRENVFAAV